MGRNEAMPQGINIDVQTIRQDDAGVVSVHEDVATHVNTSPDETSVIVQNFWSAEIEDGISAHRHVELTNRGVDLWVTALAHYNSTTSGPYRSQALISRNPDWRASSLVRLGNQMEDPDGGRFADRFTFPVPYYWPTHDNMVLVAQVDNHSGVTGSAHVPAYLHAEARGGL